MQAKVKHPGKAAEMDTITYAHMRVWLRGLVVDQAAVKESFDDQLRGSSCRCLSRSQGIPHLRQHPEVDLVLWLSTVEVHAGTSETEKLESCPGKSGGRCPESQSCVEVASCGLRVCRVSMRSPRTPHKHAQFVHTRCRPSTTNSWHWSQHVTPRAFGWQEACSIGSHIPSLAARLRCTGSKTKTTNRSRLLYRTSNTRTYLVHS